MELSWDGNQCNLIKTREKEKERRKIEGKFYTYFTLPISTHHHTTRAHLAGLEDAKTLLRLLLHRILHHVDPPQPLAVAGIKEGIGAVIVEPVPSTALLQAVPVDLDPLHLAQLYESVPAHQERKKGRGGRDAAKSPVGLLDEVLQVHAVETR